MIARFIVAWVDVYDVDWTDVLHNLDKLERDRKGEKHDKK